MPFQFLFPRPSFSFHLPTLARLFPVFLTSLATSFIYSSVFHYLKLAFTCHSSFSCLLFALFLDNNNLFGQGNVMYRHVYYESQSPANDYNTPNRLQIATAIP